MAERRALAAAFLALGDRRALLELSRPKGQILDDWAPTLRILDRALLVLGLVGTQLLTTDRALVNVAPFPVRDVGEAPCTVVAEPLEP